MVPLIALAAFVATLLGGFFALRLSDKLHLILGFSAGAIIGVAFFDLLPEAIESLPKTKVLFKGPDGQPGGRVEVRHMDEVASMIARDPTGTGSPKYVACEWNTGLAPGPADRGGIELRVFPIPDRAYTLGFRARYSAIPFTSATQKGQWPQVHDLTIVALAVVEYFRHDRKPDSPSLGVAQTAADAALAAAAELRTPALLATATTMIGLWSLATSASQVAGSISPKPPCRRASRVCRFRSTI